MAGSCFPLQATETARRATEVARRATEVARRATEEARRALRGRAARGYVSPPSSCLDRETSLKISEMKKFISEEISER